MARQSAYTNPRAGIAGIFNPEDIGVPYPRDVMPDNGREYATFVPAVDEEAAELARILYDMNVSPDDIFTDTGIWLGAGSEGVPMQYFPDPEPSVWPESLSSASYEDIPVMSLGEIAPGASIYDAVPGLSDTEVRFHPRWSGYGGGEEGERETRDAEASYSPGRDTINIYLHPKHIRDHLQGIPLEGDLQWSARQKLMHEMNHAAMTKATGNLFRESEFGLPELQARYMENPKIAEFVERLAIKAETNPGYVFYRLSPAEVMARINEGMYLNPGMTPGQAYEADEANEGFSLNSAYEFERLLGLRTD